jgi:hypothetical protein
MSFQAEGLTSPIFILGEHILEGLKWLARHGLNTMESVYNVGLDMGVLCRPSKAMKLLVSGNHNTFEEWLTSFRGGEDGLAC